MEKVKKPIEEENHEDEVSFKDEFIYQKFIIITGIFFIILYTSKQIIDKR